ARHEAAEFQIDHKELHVTPHTAAIARARLPTSASTLSIVRRATRRVCLQPAPGPPGRRTRQRTVELRQSSLRLRRLSARKDSSGLSGALGLTYDRRKRAGPPASRRTVASAVVLVVVRKEAGA